MATLVLKNDAPIYGSVFQDIVVSYGWEFPSCVVYSNAGALAIRVDVSFASNISVGTFVQVLNGSYKGTYKATLLESDATYLYITTDGTFVSSDPLSNRFNIDERQTFELFAGYQTGTGATVKPYVKIADISVAINPNTLNFDVPIHSYLRSYFSIDSPTVGKDYNLSLQYDLTYSQDDPSEQTIDWELIEQLSPFVDANIRIRVNNVTVVEQFGGASGTLNVNSGDVIEVYSYGNSIYYNQSLSNQIQTYIEDSDSVVVYNFTNFITNYAPTVVGETLFTFTVIRDKDYDITITSSGS